MLAVPGEAHPEAAAPAGQAAHDGAVRRRSCGCMPLTLRNARTARAVRASNVPRGRRRSRAGSGGAAAAAPTGRAGRRRRAAAARRPRSARATAVPSCRRRAVRGADADRAGAAGGSAQAEGAGRRRPRPTFAASLRPPAVEPDDDTSRRATAGRQPAGDAERRPARTARSRSVARVELRRGRGRSRRRRRGRRGRGRRPGSWLLGGGRGGGQARGECGDGEGGAVRGACRIRGRRPLRPRERGTRQKRTVSAIASARRERADDEERDLPGPVLHAPERDRVVDRVQRDAGHSDPVFAYSREQRPEA